MKRAIFDVVWFCLVIVTLVSGAVVSADSWFFFVWLIFCFYFFINYSALKALAFQALFKEDYYD